MIDNSISNSSACYQQEFTFEIVKLTKKFYFHNINNRNVFYKAMNRFITLCLFSTRLSGNRRAANHWPSLGGPCEIYFYNFHQVWLVSEDYWDYLKLGSTFKQRKPQQQPITAQLINLEHRESLDKTFSCWLSSGWPPAACSPWWWWQKCWLCSRGQFSSTNFILEHKHFDKWI